MSHTICILCELPNGHWLIPGLPNECVKDRQRANQIILAWSLGETRAGHDHA